MAAARASFLKRCSCSLVEHAGVGQDLQGHGAAQRNLLGLIHDPHAAAADFADEAEVAEDAGDVAIFFPIGQPSRGRNIEHGQGGKYLPDDVGDLRMLLGILFDAGRAPLFDVFSKSLGHFGDERFDVGGSSFAGGFHGFGLRQSFGHQQTLELY